MNKCELCPSVARTHCDSDQASLCWDCDYKVHNANFLVARHSRTLLCHVCQSPTPWSATGTKLGPTVSVCDNCIRVCDNTNKRGVVGYVDTDVEIESDAGNSDEGTETWFDKEEEGIDNKDIQVVPWSPTTPPPPASSSSNSDAEAEADSESYSSSSLSLPSSPWMRSKRNLQNGSDLRLNGNHSPATVARRASGEVGGRGGRKRALKRRRLVDLGGGVEFLSRNSRAIVASIGEMHRREMRSRAAAVEELMRIIGDPGAVDCDIGECSQS